MLRRLVGLLMTRMATMLLPCVVYEIAPLSAQEIRGAMHQPDGVPLDKRYAALLVSDATNHPIPYATVILNGGTARVTDTTGRLVLPTGDQDTLNLNVRRIGFALTEFT